MDNETKAKIISHGDRLTEACLRSEKNISKIKYAYAMMEGSTSDTSLALLQFAVCALRSLGMEEDEAASYCAHSVHRAWSVSQPANGSEFKKEEKYKN